MHTWQTRVCTQTKCMHSITHIYTTPRRTCINSCTHIWIHTNQDTIIKRGTRLISRVRSISKWPPHWIYYDLNANISRKQPHFTHIRTYQVFVSLPHTAGTVRTCSNIADVRDRSTSKTRFSSSSFYVSMFLSMFLSCQKHYYAVTRSYEKLRERA